LREGQYVVTNRYIFTVFAFFMAREKVDMHWLAASAAGIIRPDVCFFLDTPAAVLTERVRMRDGPAQNRFDQDPGFVDKFNQAFRRLAAANDIVTLQGEQSPEELISRCIDSMYSRGLINSR
jgi:thymidylate kinase